MPTSPPRRFPLVALRQLCSLDEAAAVAAVSDDLLVARAGRRAAAALRILHARVARYIVRSLVCRHVREPWQIYKKNGSHFVAL